MTRCLVALAAFCALPQVVSAQADTSTVPADTLVAGLRLRPATPPFALTPPAALRLPGAGDAWLPGALREARWEAAIARTLDSARAEQAVARRLAQVYGAPLSVEDSLAVEAMRQRDEGLLGVGRQYADLVIDAQARLEIRTDRLRNERCTPALLLDPNSGCRGGFDAPRLENDFTIRSGGIIGQRLHVNVDYDSQREFSGTNSIQLYYQGLDDEIIRRIEIGTVQFVAPTSRFLSAAIPTNNFGVSAGFELGPVRMQALAATQKGSVVAERTYTIGQQASQQQERALRDLDIETGRFFWVVDPAGLPGYPAVDILGVSGDAIDAAQRPVELRVYRKRAVQIGNGNPNLGGIPAVALRPDSDQRAEGEWELLVQGTDYYVDPSALWIALSATLGRNDFLAVSYVTAAGTRVGTFPATASAGALDTLRLIVDPLRGPEVPTFRHEMRQIYRIAGSDLERSSLSASVTLGQSDRPAQGLATYLAQLGLAVPTDPAVLDRENRLFPRTQDPGASDVIGDTYIVFPHLTPFADPIRLTEAERSDSLYRTPAYLLLTQGPPARFQLRVRYNSLGGGDRNSFNLNALQIREGTERLAIGGRVLQRDVDYTIAYETGQVTFLNPDALFGTGAATVTARFEEQGIFAVAPTSIMGFSTQYALGEAGVVNLVGMYQREQTVFTRPQLGFEAKANLVGGANTRLTFQPSGVTRFVNGLTSSPATAPSLLDVSAEVAFTRPDPNRSGAAYLEEFEADAGFQVTLREGQWSWGSRPQRGDGLEALGFATGFDSAAAVQLSWQNLVRAPGNVALQFRPADIDPNVRIIGRGETYETVLFLTLHADTAGGYLPFGRNASRWTQPERPAQPRWRSIVTPLSNVGVDVSRHEYLEFWVLQSLSSADAAGAQLVIDLGSVSEDALVVVPESLTVAGGDTLYTGRRYSGVGTLDTERAFTGTWDASRNDTGIHGDRPDLIFTPEGPLDRPTLCTQELSTSVLVYPWGDLSSRCTNGNGQLDTEDLNADFVLDASGPNDDVQRYIVPLTDDQSGTHFVREGGRFQNADGSSAVWRLYRVPLRSPDATIGVPNDRLVRQIRLTVAAPPDGGTDQVARFALARMRFVGSSWVRRSLTPTEGLAGSVGAGHGEVIASIISTENEELGYESPPGVRDAGNRQDGNTGDLGTQVNEKSLRVIARGLLGGERAEAYLRFPAGAQNLLSYREMRVWARGRGPGWDDNELEVFVKLGSDDRNFYLYRAPARTATWEPELVIDLERWRALRGDVETRWLRGDQPNGADCGVDPSVYAACDGGYLVHLGTPGVSPPNLAAVQEVAAGIWRPAGDTPIDETEVWVDDIRLTAPIGETGVAVAADVRLAASDVGDVSVGFLRQDGNFHQIGRLPTYRTTNVLTVGSALRIDRFLPTSLGLTVPATLTFSRSAVDPQLVAGTDLRGDALEGLRRPEAWDMNTSLTIRRGTRGRTWLTRGLVDPMILSFAHARRSTTSELSEASAVSTSVLASYSLQLDRRGPTLSLGGLVGGLPDWLRNSEGLKSLESIRVSLVPRQVRMSSGLVHDDSDYRGFQVPVEREADASILPTRSLTHTWRNSAGLTWQPLGMLTLGGDLSSTRDLRRYSDSTALGRLATSERQALLGMDVGVERDRNLTTQFLLNPRISSWLRPRFSTSSSFALVRTLSSRTPVREIDDTAGAFFLPQTLNNSRQRELGAAIDVARVMRGLFGDSALVTRVTRRVRSFDVTRRVTRSSTFDLAAFDPGLAYQLGFGDLDAFQEQSGIRAVGAAEVRATTFGAGAELPGGISGTLSYTRSETDRYQRAQTGFRETRSSQVEWPVGSLRMTRAFRGGPFATIAAGTTFRRREGRSVQPSASGVFVNSTESLTFAPDVVIGFRNRIGLSLGLSSLDQETLTNGRLTITDRDDWTGTVSYSFRVPEMISSSRKLVRSTMTVQLSNALSCLEAADSEECITISNVIRRELRGGLSTDLNSSITGEFQAGYSLNDAKHLDRRTSQIFLSVGVQLSLFAGDYR